MKKFAIVGTLMTAVCAMPVLAWDVEHDEVAMLVGEFLPKELKNFFTFDDFDTLISYCHYPDMTDWAPRHFRTLDEIEQVVGKRDREIIEKRGYSGYWMHTEDGKATFMTLMARAFARGEHRLAAFYLSAISHPVGDESALNHPPLLNYYQYCHFEGVDFGAKKVEAGSKNVFGFRSDGGVVKHVREKLQGYRAKLPPVEGFQEQMLWHCEQVVPQSVYAAEKEAEIGFAKCPDPEEALADLVAMQVKAIVDIAWTCWVNRAVDAPLPAPDFKERFDRRVAELESRADPSRQAVFGELFDAARNPANPKGMVGVACEAVGFRGAGVQSYVDRIVSGACGRTLRDRGWAVKGISLRALKPGMLSVAETPIVIAAMGNAEPSAEQVAAFIEFRKQGGRLIYISGRDPEVGAARKSHGDRGNVSGFAEVLEQRAPEEVPASPGWHGEGACKDWRTMTVEFGGKRYPLKRDANGDGWSKSVCALAIKSAADIEPLAYLDNGTTRFCVAARRGNSTWLPVYMLSPFLFCEETKLDLGSLRLDSFAEKVLMAEVEVAGVAFVAAGQASRCGGRRVYLSGAARNG